MIGQDCGCLPVVDRDGRIVGTVTDRDLAVRVLAKGKGPDTRVGEIMSPDPSCCSIDDDLSAVEHIMEERQVRRVPVLDESGCCIGIIAQADLARHRRTDVPDREIAEVVSRISRPSERPRAEAQAGRRPEAR